MSLTAVIRKSKYMVMCCQSFTLCTCRQLSVVFVSVLNLGHKKALVLPSIILACSG